MGLAGVATAAIAAAALAQNPPPLARLNLRETELTAEQAHNMSQLARLLSVVEQLRRDPPPALLVSPQDARDAARAAILVKALTPELQARARVYAREAGEMVRQRRLAAVASEAVFTSESRRADAAPAPREPSPPLRGDQPAPFRGPMAPPERLLTPVSGQIVRRFAEPAPGGGRANGLTYAAARGARVGSPSAGVVQYAGPVKGWGVILILRLTGGYHLVLAGLAQASVAVGQSVAPGQPVGWMPDARQSSSELYLEVREGGAPVDPGRWMTR
ncbi:peptidoglycan DD-metalloendopeptidase family protein [Phenylobacterium sp. LjRoot225]|uniref:murein hydrolase activator EnvC family protein n=1 Tax=Phenylobacterium sp. LjRoot225 TaxID=3342285 RepID=UPI003ECCC315